MRTLARVDRDVRDGSTPDIGEAARDVRCRVYIGHYRPLVRVTPSDSMMRPRAIARNGRLSQAQYPGQPITGWLGVDSPSTG